MSELKEGQRVEVSYTGTFHRTSSSQVGVVDDDGKWHTYDRDGTVSVKPATPAYWPPQWGDVWAAGDDEYFVVEMPRKTLTPVKASSRTFYEHENWDDFLALSPVLKYRRES